MNWLRRFMYGRYGGDQLSWFLLAVYVLLVVPVRLPHLEPLSWLALCGAVLVLLPHLSRQYASAGRKNACFSYPGWTGHPLV